MIAVYILAAIATAALCGSAVLVTRIWRQENDGHS